MKAIGSFTPSSSTAIVILDDEHASRYVSSIEFFVLKNGSTSNYGFGFSDITNNNSTHTYTNGTKYVSNDTTKCILAKDDSGTVNVRGYIPSGGFDYSGEFQVNFDTYNTGYKVFYRAEVA